MNSLSEQTPTTATHRLPEDQDLLERSTKKPKHFRGAPMASPHHPTEGDMQDSPVASGGATPDSGQADQDDNESTRRARTVFKQTPPEKYGSWMLVTKQKRGNRPRAQNQNVEVAAKYTTKFNNPMFDGIGSQSRFAPLQDFDESELNQDKTSLTLATMAQTS
nr:uncharacterized protein LOC109173568 [Ipomoea trifida]